jgi:ribosomal protein S18 acetylase RimI-like enzyme
MRSLNPRALHAGVSVQLEILDIRHFSAGSLRPVLEEESRVWTERLHWDYRASANLLLQYLDSHVLPGFVAVENGRVCGYIFCVYESTKAVIGDVFVAQSLSTAPACEVESRLLVHMIELLQNSPNIERIESQLLLHTVEAHRAVFERSGFHIYPRLFMEQNLENPSVTELPRRSRGAIGLPEGLAIRPWSETDFVAVGRLIADAYDGHLDGIINDQYRTVSGSLRFLHNIVRFPGCGIFEAVASRVIYNVNTEQLVAAILCSRVRDDVGHITQVCVAREHRRKGIASLLLAAAAAELRGRDFRILSLTVTEANANAVALYRERGFEAKHTFSSMYWEH